MIQLLRLIILEINITTTNEIITTTLIITLTIMIIMIIIIIIILQEPSSKLIYTNAPENPKCKNERKYLKMHGIMILNYIRFIATTIVRKRLTFIISVKTLSHFLLFNI